MKDVWVNLGERKYRIFIGSLSIKKLGWLVSDLSPTQEAAVISDETVSRLYGKTVTQSLESAGISSKLLTVPDGEESKSLQCAEKLYTGLIEMKLNRDGLIIALGGGVIGDLAGFVASTYLRGIPFVQVPTTLLAQVDSSVGGKVGINHSLGKNLIGSFYQPRFVLIDPNVLLTLKKREIWSGLAEVVKMALICNERFFSFLEENMTDSCFKKADIFTDMIEFCCKAKADVVEKDEKEEGYRRVLNFGHTLGHALEALTQYKLYRHGEAIVYGMHWALWVSKYKGYLPEKKFLRIKALLSRFPVPPLPTPLDPVHLCSKIQTDKKNSKNGLSLVLLEDIEKPKVEIVKEIPELIKGWMSYGI